MFKEQPLISFDVSIAEFKTKCGYTPIGSTARTVTFAFTLFWIRYTVEGSDGSVASFAGEPTAAMADVQNYITNKARKTIKAAIERDAAEMVERLMAALRPEPSAPEIGADGRCHCEGCDLYRPFFGAFPSETTRGGPFPFSTRRQGASRRSVEFAWTDGVDASGLRHVDPDFNIETFAASLDALNGGPIKRAIRAATRPPKRTERDARPLTVNEIKRWAEMAQHPSDTIVLSGTEIALIDPGIVMRPGSGWMPEREAEIVASEVLRLIRLNVPK